MAAIPDPAAAAAVEDSLAWVHRAALAESNTSVLFVTTNTRAALVPDAALKCKERTFS